MLSKRKSCESPTKTSATTAQSVSVMVLAHKKMYIWNESFVWVRDRWLFIHVSCFVWPIGLVNEEGQFHDGALDTANQLGENNATP